MLMNMIVVTSQYISKQIELNMIVVTSKYHHNITNDTFNMHIIR